MSSTPEMVERVARAIFAAMDLTDGLDAEAAEVYARAAIAAMREPTEAMKRPNTDWSDGERNAAVYTAMIERALR